MKRYNFIHILLGGLLLFSGSASAQTTDTWPFFSYSIYDEDPNMRELTEWYGNRNILARGPVTKSGETKVIDGFKNNREVTNYIYVRTGTWTIYFDSSVSVVRSRGTYENGEKHGEWKVYDRYGNLKREYVFDHEVIRQQTDFDMAGNKTVVIDRDSMGVLFVRYHTFFLIFSLLPITLVRISCNILTWNHVNGTRYIPGFADYQKGGVAVNVFAALIFVWAPRNEDTSTITRYKKMANWISLVSIIILALFCWAESVYG